MATNNILLLQKVDNLGYEGDIVTVRAGYARNYLLPQKLAIPVTYANKKQIDALIRRREERKVHELEHARELAQQVCELTISFSVKAGEQGKMFGAITAADLAKKFEENSLKIERKKIHLEPVKSLGTHKAEIKLHNDVVVEFLFEVTQEAVA